MESLSIETITYDNSNEVSYSPIRGGIITSLKLNGKEILYLDEETFKNTKENVKGGIPVLFPNAGPVKESEEFPNIKQHGFARNSEWKAEETEDGFKETLISNVDTKKVYPYDFCLSVSGKFENDGSFTLSQEIENKEKDRELPVSIGLHPYFKVSNEDKKNIKFNFEGGNQIEEQSEIWANGTYISIDNPKVKDSSAVMEVNIPSVGTLLIDASKEYQKIWVWSMEGKDFVCIEPVMRDINGLVDDPEKVKPLETLKSSVNFKLKK